jgi:hypothetical protein
VRDNSHFVLKAVNNGHSMGLIAWKFPISYVAGVAGGDDEHLWGVYSLAFHFGLFVAYYFGNCT